MCVCIYVCVCIYIKATKYKIGIMALSTWYDVEMDGTYI